MTISAESLRFDDDSMGVELSDGRVLGVPLAWFPRLLNATPRQRLAFEISREGLHWDELARIFRSRGYWREKAIRRRLETRRAR